MSAASLSRAAEKRYLAAHPGCKLVMGVDEAGRGPLCGPVVAAACIVLEGDGGSGDEFTGITDSKKVVAEADREATYEILTKHPRCFWGIGIVDNKTIDEINILQASLLAMRIAAQDLLDKAKKDSKKGNSSSKTLVGGEKILALVDGNKVPENMPTAQTVFVIKGDSLIYSIAAASIIAKVTRDRIMHAYDKQYPLYRLSQHKGYPTFDHRKILYDVGPCEIYRFTFGPVKMAAEHHANLKSAKDASKSSPSAQSVVKSAAKSAAKIAAKSVAGKTSTTSKSAAKVRSEPFAAAKVVKKAHPASKSSASGRNSTATPPSIPRSATSLRRSSRLSSD